MVIQFTTRTLLGDLVQRIDEIEHQNFHVPQFEHGSRILKTHERAAVHSGNHKFTQADYVDGYIKTIYNTDWIELRELTDTAQIKTLERLNNIIQSAVYGETVTLSQLRSVLTAEQYSNYQSSLTDIRFTSEILYGDGMPDVLKQYNLLVNKADFAWHKIESKQSRARANNTPRTANKKKNNADALYETALERLEEIFGCAERGDYGADMMSQLDAWMDRTIDFDKGLHRTVGIEPETIPRVHGSKSCNALDSGLPKLSKRLKQQYCALLALLEAAFSIAFVFPVTETEKTQTDAVQLKAKLKQMIRTLDSAED